MPRSKNQILHDALVRHQVYMIRTAGTLRRKVLAVLDKTEGEIKLALVSGDTSSRVKLLSVLNKVRKIRRAGWKTASAVWLNTLIDIAKNEPLFLNETVNAIAPIALALDKLEAPKQTVTRSRILGKTPVEWFAGAAASDEDRIITQLQLGADQEQDQKAWLAGFALQGLRTQRDIETLSLTSVLGITGLISVMLLDDPSNYWRFVAVLDSRTTLLCRSLNGKKYLRGKGPYPPLHWRCRSMAMPLIKGWGPGQEDESFGALLTRQSKPFQDSVLGPKRGNLFRAGKVSADRFVDYSTNHTFTLAELRAHERKG